MRPLRSVLFARGDDRESLEKAVASGADSIVADLEEPRTPYSEADRERGRTVARAFFDAQSSGSGPLLFARVQPWSTGQTLKDLRAVVGRAAVARRATSMRRPVRVAPATSMMNGAGS